MIFTMLSELTQNALTKPLFGWSENIAGGNKSLNKSIDACLTRFLVRHAPIVFVTPSPGTRALIRLYRASAIVTDDGVVRSTELMRIPNIDAFMSNFEERKFVISSTSYDDKAALFCAAPPPMKTRETPSLLDWDGSNVARSIHDQVRQFEFLLNRELLENTDMRILFEDGKLLIGGYLSHNSHRHLRQDIENSFRSTLLCFAKEATRNALAEFRTYLDSDILEAASKAGANSVQAYNWLCGWERKARNTILSRNRCQAVKAYPLAWTFLSSPVGKVSEALTKQLPLAPALANALGIPEQGVRRLNGLGVVEAGIDGTASTQALHDIAQKVLRMPPGQAPKTSNGWKSYFAAIELCQSVERATRDHTVTQNLLTSGSGKWDSMDSTQLAQAAGGVVDMILDFHNNVGGPICGDEWRRDMSAHAIIGGRTLTQVAEASAWWHKMQTDLRARLRTLFPLKYEAVEKQIWPALHKDGQPWVATNGLTLCPLITEASLSEEASRMDHCVDRYAPNCLYGGSHILSVRNEHGISLGTVEIMQDRILPLVKTLSEPPNENILSMPPSVKQFQARSNQGRPITSAWEALWEYVSGIMTGAIEVDVKLLKESLERRRAAVAEKPSISCYDSNIPGAINEAWACYAPILPKTLAKKGPLGLQKFLENPMNYGLAMSR